MPDETVEAAQEGGEAMNWPTICKGCDAPISAEEWAGNEGYCDKCTAQCEDYQDELDQQKREDEKAAKR